MITESPVLSKSERAILDSSKALFWKYGVKKVSVEEICKEAGVSKMTFYRSFKNKVDLVSVMLDQITTDGLRQYQEIMNQDLSFPEKVNKLILMKHHNAEGISEEFVRDVFLSDQEEWQKKIQAYQAFARGELRKDFEKAQKEGWIREDLSIDFILYILEDMQLKVKSPQFLALHKNDLHRSIMEVTKFFFYGVIPVKEHKSE